MRCDKCKFWEAPDDQDEWDEVTSLFGHCERTPYFDDMSEWDGKMQRIVNPEYTDRTAFSSSVHYACLRVKAEHFCAMFAEAAK